MSYAIGELAALAHVTVRTLHHYDEIGLLSPRARTPAGYRRYSDRDLERLQQILFYRELGFSLDQIAGMLDRPSGTIAQLRAQRRLIEERIARLQAMLAAVDKALEAEHMGIPLTPEERFEVFGAFVPEEHEAEARERWGGAPAYAESQRRVGKYTKEDWQQLEAEAGEILRELAAAMHTGTAAGTTVPMDLAERHRQHISRWFYECSYDVHRGLAEMYVTDPRFATHFEQVASGLTGYLRDAIVANSARRA